MARLTPVGQAKPHLCVMDYLPLGEGRFWRARWRRGYAIDRTPALAYDRLIRSMGSLAGKRK